MTMEPLNLDPIEIITKRVLPGGEVEVLMRLSERDRERLLADYSARYSIAAQHVSPLSPRDEFYDYLNHLTSVQQAARPQVAKAFFEQHQESVDADVWLKREREGNWSLERCETTAAALPGRQMRCKKPEGHPGGHVYESEPVEEYGEVPEVARFKDPQDDERACRATAVFWPDQEACEAICWLAKGHPEGAHEDQTLGIWDEDELLTFHRED